MPSLALTYKLVQNVIQKVPFVLECPPEWLGSCDEHVGKMEWIIVAELALRDARLGDAFFSGLIAY